MRHRVSPSEPPDPLTEYFRLPRSFPDPRNPGKTERSYTDMVKQYQSANQELGDINTFFRKNILCLSGGGNRAAAYHLGALKRLQELGYLQLIDIIRSVSGGSIVAGLLAKTVHVDGIPLAEIDFVEFGKTLRKLLTRDIRTGPILATVGRNLFDKEPRVNMLVKKMKTVVGDSLLSELTGAPAFHFLTTDLGSGRSFEFRTGEDSPVDQEWELARVIVASACFPPLFGPMVVMPAPLKRLSTDEVPLSQEDLDELYAAKEARRLPLALRDGGLWVNDATSLAFMNNAKIVFVSDASRLGETFRFKKGDVRPWFIRDLMVRMRVGTLMSKDVEQKSQQPLSDESDRSTTKIIRWSIHETSGLLPGQYEYDEEVTERVARVRTDMSAFLDAETKVIENHGYLGAAQQIGEAQLPSGAMGLDDEYNPVPGPPEETPDRVLPHPEFDTTEAALAALRYSTVRFHPGRGLERAARSLSRCLEQTSGSLQSD
jgi:NTE family protein